MGDARRVSVRKLTWDHGRSSDEGCCPDICVSSGLGNLVFSLKFPLQGCVRLSWKAPRVCVDV